MRTGSPWMRALTVLLTAAGGVVLGLLSVHVLFSGSALVLIPWAAVCAFIGAVAKRRSMALACGAVFGFTVVISFLVGGYAGERSVVTALGFFVALSALGAVIAAATAAAANLLVRQAVRR